MQHANPGDFTDTTMHADESQHLNDQSAVVNIGEMSRIITNKTQPTINSAEGRKGHTSGGNEVNDRSSSKIMIPDEIFANNDYDQVRTFNLTD